MSKGGGDNSVTTKDVVVEANQAKEEAKYESQQTTIITSEDIEKKQAKSVEDIIFHETGLSRSVDAMGRVTVSIRGAEPRHTLILIDGQPVMGDFAKYSGQADELQRLGTENVDHIEIVQGAASAKYGSDAIGGVINVVTKKAAKTPSMQLNVEGRRMNHDGDAFPYQNVFMRADSGQVGKFRAAIYGSKREIMPVYSTETTHGSSITDTNGTATSASADGSSVRNTLRYSGDIKNIGFSTSYDFNDRNSLDFNMERTTEDMNRTTKYSSEILSPEQNFSRDVTRDTYRLNYKGNNGGSTDWHVSFDYAKMHEDDLTVTSYSGKSNYQGTNILNYVDNLIHKQWNFKASANTQVNDQHLLTYGFGYTHEVGTGSRIKNAPKSWYMKINPTDYDKNLMVQNIGSSNATGEPVSTVHDYAFTTVDGVPQYDQNYEYYGHDANGNQIIPPITQSEFTTYSRYKYYYDRIDQYPEYASYIPDTVDMKDLSSKYNTFVSELTAENGSMSDIVYRYFYPGVYSKDATYKGQKFMEEYNSRDNRLTIGEVEMNKYNLYLQDTWQVNDNTILTPIVRLDHSDTFGSEVTANLGLTHNLGGNAHRRLKANVGTGYTEPGMGELYYNWEMYAGFPTGYEVGRLGYYWVGNKDLKPEKSVNFDIGIEGENGKTSARLNVFHNKIDNYITTYFTGQLMDFYPDSSVKWLNPPDMIYSFKNIGKAEITGVEAEVNHRFNDHWSGKLGYTYLHAVNKSDPDMPDQLLNKPQHKVDIGVTYENNGWTASLWGDYYIHMLDSNSVAGGNYWIDGGPSFSTGKKQEYKKKTFGLWNILISKELSKDAKAYVGVDNLFNHRDDDQAFQERVYKVGLNLKFGSDGQLKAETPTVDGAKEMAREKIRGDKATDWFIKAPFDTTKEQGVEVIGDYRARWNSFTGETKPSQAKVTSTSHIGTAEKNYLEKAEHGFEQRLRLGVDARIGDNTNVTVLGSASGMSGVDTMHDVSDSKGLNHQRVENIDVTQHANKWDFSVGRLTEPMGVTGYWFGKEYDGGRAVWTSGKNQVRIGYGDFSHSTGISDSAYTHAVRESFYRAPTKAEWLGYAYESIPNGDGYVTITLVPKGDGYEGMYQKVQKAQTLEEQAAIIRSYLDIIKEKDPDAYNSFMEENNRNGNLSFTLQNVQQPIQAWKKYTIINNDTSEVVGTYYQCQTLNNGDRLYVSADNFVDTSLNAESFSSVTAPTMEFGMYGRNFELDMGETILPDGTTINATIKEDFLGWGSGEYDGSLGIQKDTTLFKLDLGEEELYSYNLNVISEEDMKGTFTEDLTAFNEASKTNNLINEWLYRRIDDDLNPEDGSTLPLTMFADGSQGLVLVESGTVLNHDVIPSIDRAAFAQVKHQFGNDFGVQAWWLRSVNDDTHSFSYANGSGNDVYRYEQLANVIGLGATWRINDNIRLSYDYGQNRTDFGRMMNGRSVLNQTTNASGYESYDYAGREAGGTPKFWVARVDIGHADMDKPGSWNAFADYKYFQHGSFFGGNGTEALPDRYLDGIKSFTIGGGYVPAKDFLIEAFYTFDAKGIHKRDTLYGPESFGLGDYTRIQATFRF